MNIKLDFYIRKIKKLIQNPPIFLRDYLNKRHPVTYTELSIDEVAELVLITYLNGNNLLASNSSPVDVVFTWVDNTDPLWRIKYEDYAHRTNTENLGLFAMDVARFDNHNELYYSVKAVKKYLPWVNNIYIITDGQTPDWLSEFQNIYIVDHTHIIEKQYLPTFNSHVIEAFLHKIPNLSENFIYFNDDVFVAKQLSKEHFFSANDLASIFVSSKILSNMAKRGVQTPTLRASQNSLDLLSRAFNHKVTNTLVHTYYPLKKSAYQKVWKIFEQDIRQFLPNRFRGNNDINMASFFVPWFMYYEGKATERLDICYYFNIRSRKALTCYDRLIKLKQLDASPHSFCANDFNTELKNQVPDYQERLLCMLEKYYS